MKPAEFHSKLTSFPKVDPEFVLELTKLGGQHPYCQLFPVLLARAGKNALGENSTPEETADVTVAIHRAAVFTADRAQLKELLETTGTLFTERTSSKTIVEAVEKNNLASVAPIQSTAPETESREVQIATPASDEAGPLTLDHAEPLQAGETYADRVLRGIETLKNQLDKFESFQVITDSSGREVISTRRKKPKAADVPAAEAQTAPPEGKQEPKRKPKRASDPGEILLDEIKTAHKKQKPDNDRQVEQLEIIDRFIKIKPETVRPAPAKALPTPADLSVNNDTYSENVISETLVDLLIRQGKREKAVDVLKKLIWKFPQKKALFAARIQELSK